MAGMSLLWHNSRLFDFVDPPRNTALRSADRAVGEQESDVLNIHIDQFLLPVVPADATAYVSDPPPNGGSGVSLEEVKKPSRVRITRKKIITAVGSTARRL
ncbi:hypothetical protein Hanom_Chr16g01433121 [Helianthus anomalus]